MLHNRIKKLREIANLKRPDIEIMSKGKLKARAIESIEFNRAKPSIQMLTSIVDFYNNLDIKVSYDWVIKGIGDYPKKLEHKHKTKTPDTYIELSANLNVFLKKEIY